MADQRAEATVGDVVPSWSRTMPRKGMGKIHAARLREVPYPPGVGGSFLYPESKGLCGGATWGPANGDLSAVDCKRCIVLLGPEGVR